MNRFRAFSLKNVANLYTVLWLLYYMQGTLYTSGGPIGVAIISFFLIISLVFFIKVNLRGTIPIYLKSLNILVVLFTIYGVIRIISSEEIYRTGGIWQNPITYLKSYYISVLPVYAFYYFSILGKIDVNWLRQWFVVFIFFVMFQYYTSEVSLFNALSEKGIETDLITNNMGYYFVSLMCLIPFFNKESIIQYIILLICGFFVISSAKRGAMFCFTINTLILLFNNLRHSSIKKKVTGIILGGSCLFSGYVYMNYMMTNTSFARRFILESGFSSGRDSLYVDVINHIFNENSIFSLIFGNGADASIAIFGNYAHNDWLEFAIDMGILGVLAYLSYYISFFKTIKDSKNFTIQNVLLFLFISCVMKSIYSMAIADFQIYESAALAYCLAYNSKLKYCGHEYKF